jgi:uncharacterized low-complexity protein
MKSSLKQTIFAMATAALSVTAACSKDAGPTASETGAEPQKTATGAAMAEGSCGEGDCGEGDCGGGGGDDGSD